MGFSRGNIVGTTVFLVVCNLSVIDEANGLSAKFPSSTRNCHKS